jgi:glycerol-3-phosphate dehydrogenase (NAD(P)+)
VVEGYETTRSFAGLCAGAGIDAPILNEMNAILFQGPAPADAISALMMRELKRETVSAFART